MHAVITDVFNSTKPCPASDDKQRPGRFFLYSKKEIHLTNPLRDRDPLFEMTRDEFRKLGYKIVDEVSDLLASLEKRPVTPGKKPHQIREALGTGSLPEGGTHPEQILDETIPLLFENSTFNGHPRFWGYITSSATPVGILSEMLAAGINPNVGGWALSPMASEIELQSIRWMAELTGFPSDCGGVLVSGGNLANFAGFLAARRAKADWNIRTDGLRAGKGNMLVYASRETHTWIEKAADLFGLGTQNVRWIETDHDQRMKTAVLKKTIESDRDAGNIPFCVVGTAGTVGTGAVDPLQELVKICREFDLWFHVDGAYGAFAAALPEASADLKALSEADSVALDPHKWLYSPLEAGCTLVRDKKHLVDAFSYRPPYYKFEGEGDDQPTNFYEYGFQNSRGFRALKVWMGLRQAGRAGYTRVIREDIALAKALFDLAEEDPELEARTHHLSITTFRFVPTGLNTKTEAAETYLNDLNSRLLDRLQNEGKAFVSNAVLDKTYLLRACIVNFRTTLADIEALPGIVTRLGRTIDREIRPAALKS